MSKGFIERLLPSQPILRRDFKGKDEEYYSILYETVTKYSGIKPIKEQFKVCETPQFQMEELASSPVVAQFLQFLILVKQPKSILEIGTFIGTSTMAMARVLPEGGNILTIEKYDHFAEIARKNFIDNDLIGKIELVIGDALEEVRALEKGKTFDMVFLDGNKENYFKYFDLLDQFVSSGGLFIVDDALFHGDILNDTPQCEKGLGVKKLLEKIKASKKYHRILCPVWNGIMLMYKL